MNAHSPRDPTLPQGLAARLDPVCDRFESEWLAGRRPRLEDFLAEVEETDRGAFLRELLALDLDYRTRRGERPAAEEYRLRFPQHAAIIDDVVAVFTANHPELTREPPKPRIDSVDTLLDSLEESALLTPAQLQECRGTKDTFADTKALARHLLQRDWMTPYQINHVLQGKSEELFFDNYVLLDRLGQGGMGLVFRARHRVMNRIVALKFIRPERLANAELVKRFHREIQMAAQLAHPNIVIAYDADQAGESHFLVMEYVEGTDLARYVEKNGRRPIAQACDWIRQAARGLQHAHERGLVHRDIKPANLLLAVKENAVKVLDMGLARLSQSSEVELTALGLTQEGTVMGTPDYMAPEQAEESTTVDTRADVYSLGCTLYFLLAGHVPFPGGTLAQKLRKHATTEPEPLSAIRDDVPAGLVAVIRKMMAKRLEDRYQTPGAAAAALEPFCRPGPVAAVPIAAVAARPVAVLLSDESIAALPKLVALPAHSGETVPPSSLDSVPSVTITKPLPLIARVKEAWNRLGRRGQIIAGSSAAAVLLLLIFLLLLRKSPAPPPTEPDNRTVLERLDAKDIPPEDQPYEHLKDLKDPLNEALVAVLGEHRVRFSNFQTMAIRPGRAMLAVADNNSIRLINTRTLREAKVLVDKDGVCHTAAITSLSFSSDGKLLASGSQDNTVRLWNVETGEALPKFPKKHPTAVLKVALTPDGQRVLVGCEDPKIYVYTTAGEKVATYEGHTGPVRALTVSHDSKLAFSAAGSTAATAEQQREIHVWDIATGTPVQVGGNPRKLTGFAAFIDRLEVSPDGARLLAATNERNVYLWDLWGGADSAPLQLPAWTSNSAANATFVGDRRLATVSNGKLKLWVPDESGKAKYLDMNPIPMEVTGNALVWLAAVPRDNHPGAETDDGVLFVSGNTLRVWNFAQKKEWRPPLGHEQTIRQLAFAHQAHWLVSTGDDWTVRFWDLADLYDPATGWPKEARKAISISTPKSGWMRTAVSEDANTVLMISGEKTVTIWVWDDGNWIDRRKLPAVGDVTPNAVALNADGTRALTIGSDNVFRVWDVTRAVELKKQEGLPDPAAQPPQLGYLTEGRAYSWDGNELRLWEGLGEGEKLKFVAANGLRGSALVVAPDRSVAYLGTNSGDLFRFPRIAEGKVLPSDMDRFHRSTITSLALSPDRKSLLSISADRILNLWDLTGDPIAQPRRWHLRGTPRTILYARDGRHAAMSNDDGTIYILRLPR